MAEKGKSSLKTFGKDDSSEKSKRGRKVQFDSDDIQEPKFDVTSKLSGKFDDIPNGKGDSGRGGKGDKVVNGGKPTVQKAPLELKVEQDLPKNATCLMDCEALETLQGISEQMAILSEDPSIKIPAAFDKGLDYAKKVGLYKSPQAVRRVLEPLKKYGVSESEMCLIANISPESADEVFALIPSLKVKKSKLADPLRDALSQLALLKGSASA